MRTTCEGILRSSQSASQERKKVRYDLKVLLLKLLGIMFWYYMIPIILLDSANCSVESKGLSNEYRVKKSTGKLAHRSSQSPSL